MKIRDQFNPIGSGIYMTSFWKEIQLVQKNLNDVKKKAHGLENLDVS